jgi:hypothetical protein
MKFTNNEAAHNWNFSPGDDEEIQQKALAA